MIRILMVTMFAVAGVAAWLVKTAIETIVRNEYEGWSRLLARSLVAMASRLWSERSAEWEGELAAVHAEEGSGLGYAGQVFMGASILRAQRVGHRAGNVVPAVALIAIVAPLMLSIMVVARLSGPRVVVVRRKVDCRDGRSVTIRMFGLPNSLQSRWSELIWSLNSLALLLDLAAGTIKLSDMPLRRRVVVNGAADDRTSPEEHS